MMFGIRRPALPPLPAAGSGYRPNPPLRLHVVMPPDYGLALSHLPSLTERARGHFDTSAQCDGCWVPVALLLHENSMAYRFVNLTFERARGEMETLAARLVPGLILAFSLKLEYKGWAANMAFLVSDAGVQHDFKRYSTRYDAHALKVYELDRVAEEDNWNARAEERVRQNTPYPRLALPTGLTLEFRICSDVCLDPIAREPDRTVTLVSAHRLPPGYADALSRRRRAVIVHDDAPDEAPARQGHPNVWFGRRNSPSLPLLAQAGIRIHAEPDCCGPPSAI